MYLSSSVIFFPEKLHHTVLSEGFSLHTIVALLQSVKSGDTYRSRISNFISETQIITCYFIWVPVTQKESSSCNGE
jgi:hypothetical protein